MSEKKVAPRKEIFGWCMFDFANSAYTTVIITVFYGVIFSQFIVPKSGDIENPHALGNTLWAVALFAGMGLGSTQSASRAIIGMFAPESKSGEFFGLWGFSVKAAAAVGLFTIAWLSNIFGLKNSFLIMVVFFVISLILTFFVNEKRAVELAQKS